MQLIDANNTAEPLRSALVYARRGWFVFPVHGIWKKEMCTCKKGKKCRHPGKHPKTPNGFKDATIDEKLIREWFKVGDIANIGIATGEKSNLLVIDVDLKNNGFESIKNLGLTDTLQVDSGGGGKHFYYEYPQSLSISSSGGKLAPGVDIRANGGYIIAPPSIHISGKSYQWSNYYA